MKYRVSSPAVRLATCIVWSLACSNAWSQSNWALAPTWSQSSDSDGLRIQKASGIAMPQYTSGLKWQGLQWQEQRYRQGETALSGHGVNYVAQDIDATTGMGYTLSTGVNQGPEKNLVVGEAGWNQRANDQWQWGVFASRDWVESMGALRQGIHYDLVGANVDYQPHPRWTLIGSLAQTHFSDSQNRQQQRTRVVWDAWPDQGLTLQWAYKHQNGEKDVVNRTYFNPDRLDESMALIGWRRRMQGWQWYARLGEGWQKVNDQPSTPSRLAELQLNSPIHGNSFFKLRAGRSETVGLNGPGYVYRYVDVQWIWRLGR